MAMACQHSALLTIPNEQIKKPDLSSGFFYVIDLP